MVVDSGIKRLLIDAAARARQAALLAVLDARIQIVEIDTIAPEELGQPAPQDRAR